MEGMIIIYQGARGSGKTLSMVEQSLEYYEIGWKIYSNFRLPHACYISDNDILMLDKTSPLRDCVLMIDELQVFFDSRNWKNKSAITFSNFVQQLRKRNIILLGTTQYVDTVEKRIRQHVDILVRPEYNEDSKICICYVFDLTSLESSSKLLHYHYYYYAPPLFKLYDTYELI